MGNKSNVRSTGGRVARGSRPTITPVGMEATPRAGAERSDEASRKALATWDARGRVEQALRARRKS
jgi:hypothetical protein